MRRFAARHEPDPPSHDCPPAPAETSMGFLSKFFGGESIPPSGEKDSAPAEPQRGAAITPAPAANSELDQPRRGTGTAPPPTALPELDEPPTLVLAPRPKEPSPAAPAVQAKAPPIAEAKTALTSEPKAAPPSDTKAAPSSTRGDAGSAASTAAAPPSAPSSHPPVKAPVPPVPVAAKPPAPLAPPPRTATLLGFEAPANGRYRMSAVEAPASSRDNAPSSKVIINADDDDDADDSETPTTVAMRKPPKTIVRVGLRSKSAHELELEPFEETTSPGVGERAHAPAHAPAVELPRTELEFLGEFALQLALGPLSALWVREAKPALMAVRNAGAHAGNPALTLALETLERAFAEPPNTRIDDAYRQTVLNGLLLLEPWLPTPRDVMQAKALRERLIIEELLAHTLGVTAVARQRLKDKGYANLDRLAEVDARVLAEQAELTPEQAQNLLSAFSDYVKAHAERAPLAGRTYTQSINDALLRLESSAAAFDYTCNGDDAREKRTARRRRQQAITAMNLLLAELGEAELLGELARCSVDERLELLREWIALAGGKPR
jgi:hypothetical protein